MSLTGSDANGRTISRLEADYGNINIEETRLGGRFKSVTIGPLVAQSLIFMNHFLLLCQHVFSFVFAGRICNVCVPPSCRTAARVFSDGFWMEREKHFVSPFPPKIAGKKHGLLYRSYVSPSLWAYS